MQHKIKIPKEFSLVSEKESASNIPLSFRNRIFSSLKKNGTSKIVSLFLTLILYFYVRDASTLTRSIQVPVIQPEIPSEFIFSRKLPPFMAVKFTGKAEKMDFDTSDFRLLIKNPNPLPGSNLYIVSLYPDPPSGVTVYYTKELQLFIDRFFLRELSVIPKITLHSIKGYEIGYVIQSPRTVILKGPYETIAAMTHVETEELRIKERNDTISRRVLINNLPDFVSFAPNQPFQVELSVNILPIANSNYTVVKNIPVRCINKIPGIQMQVSGESRVSFYMSQEAGKLRRAKLPAYVYCPIFFDNETKSLRPSFLLQNQPVFSVGQLGVENVQLLKIEPSFVNLQFTWVGE